MSKFIVIITSLTLFFTIAFGQEQEDKTFIDKGSKAILFEFSGLAYLGANEFNGGIGGKYFIKSNWAIRAGVQYINVSEDVPFQGTGGIDGEAQASQFGISAALEIHITRKRISPYYGAGLNLAFASTEYKSAEAIATDQVIIKNDRDGEFGYYGGTEITIFGLAGVEVFVFKSLSLAAEYRLGFSDISLKDEERTQGNTTVTYKQGSMKAFGIASSGVLTLAVYF
jgi:hypothetical protein